MKEVVVCVGVEDSSILDSVLGPGDYETSFVSSIDGAYAHIARTLPNRVVLCVRADDEQSLRVLSMLTLDPRTKRIPVITCVASAGGGGEDLEGEDARGRGAASHRIVMH